jgi:hypothetical protein
VAGKIGVGGLNIVIKFSQNYRKSLNINLRKGGYKLTLGD